MRKSRIIYALILSILLLFTACTSSETPYVDNQIETNEIIESNTEISNDEEVRISSETDEKIEEPETYQQGSFDISEIPDYSGKAYISVNDNIPYFTKSELTTKSFERYSSLDSLGRCGVAFASIGTDIMPTEERGSIGSVKPSGWHTIKYENVDGKYLYNRCHLIGFQLSGENANERNLITGTRYMNMSGMLPFENMVADYVQETCNHVMYRVTPIFEGNNLLASGVLMEGYSVEDNGDGICFNVFCYNTQPGIKINYANGDSESENGSAPYGSSAVVATPKQETQNNSSSEANYIANKNTKKFHYHYCGSVGQMKESNKKALYCSRDEAISQGYSPCGNCHP